MEAQNYFSLSGRNKRGDTKNVKHEVEVKEENIKVLLIVGREAPFVV